MKELRKAACPMPRAEKKKRRLGRVAAVNVERDIGGGGARQGAPHKE